MVGPDELTPGRRRYLVVGALVRAFCTASLFVALYYLLPLDHISGASTVAVLCVGLLGVIVVVSWQVRMILRSEYPAMRAVEALALATPLFLLTFATTYFLMSHLSEGSFTQHLTRTDALYFTVTTFSTVGFGDITAKSEMARLIVTGQMLADLVLLGLGVRVLTRAVQQSWQRGSGAPGASGSPRAVVASPPGDK
jgi:voltage-gated potassium channel